MLNQDDARSFLGKGPEKMYALFRKATNLDQAEDKYKETLKTCDEAIEHLKMKEQVSKFENILILDVSPKFLLGTFFFF